MSTATKPKSLTDWAIAIARIALLAACAIFILLISLTALRSSLSLVRLPIELYLLDQNLPVIFRLHMAASGLALGFGLITLLVRHVPRLHRPLGRVTATAVAIGGLTALPSALWSEATIVARAGFFTQGCVWLSLLGAGIVAIRARNIARHRRAMLAMYAVASGAIWLRMATAAAVFFAWPFDVTYAAAAWLAWLIPLSLVWWITRPLATSVAVARLSVTVPTPSR